MRIIFAILFILIMPAASRAEIAAKSYVDTTSPNAANITSGTVAYARLPVGTAANTVAAGNDSRITSAEQTSNKVTTISASSTNAQYPSAKLVYDTLGNIQAALNAIIN